MNFKMSNIINTIKSKKHIILIFLSILSTIILSIFVVFAVKTTEPYSNNKSKAIVLQTSNKNTVSNYSTQSQNTKVSTITQSNTTKIKTTITPSNSIVIEATKLTTPTQSILHVSPSPTSTPIVTIISPTPTKTINAITQSPSSTINDSQKKDLQTIENLTSQTEDQIQSLKRQLKENQEKLLQKYIEYGMTEKANVLSKKIEGQKLDTSSSKPSQTPNTDFSDFPEANQSK